MFLILNILPGEGKKGEGEAVSAGLGKESLGDAAPGRRRWKTCRVDDVEQGYVRD